MPAQCPRGSVETGEGDRPNRGSRPSVAVEHRDRRPAVPPWRSNAESFARRTSLLPGGLIFASAFHGRRAPIGRGRIRCDRAPRAATLPAYQTGDRTHHHNSGARPDRGGIEPTERLVSHAEAPRPHSWPAIRVGPRAARATARLGLMARSKPLAPRARLPARRRCVMITLHHR